MKRLGIALLNVGVLCVALLLGAVGAEWALRAARLSQPIRLGWVGKSYGPPGPDLTADPLTGWKMKPNRAFVWNTEHQDQTYRANSLGFRSEHEFDPADSRYRIALVGDSYTWGSGAANENTFAALLEKDSPNVVAWNFGMPGFGVDQVWLSARYYALPMRPDLLVVGLVNADFERSQIPHREGFDKPTFKLDDGRLVQRTTEKTPTPFMQYLDQYSHLWAVWERSKRWMGTQYGFTEYWTLNQALMDALREDCRSAGVPVLFVYIPISSFKPFPAVRDYMRRTDANYIDLTQRQPPAPMSIYLPHDGHLSAEGHRYVANLIEAWIKSHPSLSKRRDP
jgi:hypothetical protein